MTLVLKGLPSFPRPAPGDIEDIECLCCCAPRLKIVSGLPSLCSARRTASCQPRASARVWGRLARRDPALGAGAAQAMPHAGPVSPASWAWGPLPQPVMALRSGWGWNVALLGHVGTPSLARSEPAHLSWSPPGLLLTVNGTGPSLQPVVPLGANPCVLLSACCQGLAGTGQATLEDRAPPRETGQVILANQVALAYGMWGQTREC